MSFPAQNLVSAHEKLVYVTQISEIAAIFVKLCHIYFLKYQMNTGSHGHIFMSK